MQKIGRDRSGFGDTLLGMTHVEFITSLTLRVRLAGAAVALDELRATRPAMISPAGAVGYHDTLAVFYVWAIDRLIAAGLNDVRVLWHPLVDVRSPRSWWDDDTLASDDGDRPRRAVDAGARRRSGAGRTTSARRRLTE